MTKLTWFMKGLRPLVDLSPIRPLFALGPNWPDLWRDYDIMAPPWINPDNNWTKLTWFMKGLRLEVPDCTSDVPVTADQIDLIYEGITTLAGHSVSSHRRSQGTKLTWFMKGLRLCGLCPSGQFHRPDQIDLIYEGITTLHQLTITSYWVDIWPNWPDLWRDYDLQLVAIN